MARSDSTAADGQGYCMPINHPGGVQAIGPDYGLEVTSQELPGCTGKPLMDKF
jgi:hypothetical protein